MGTFMPYYSAQFDHVKSLEPDLSDILFEQNNLLQQHGFIHRDFPAVIITTQTGKEIVNHYGELVDILDCDVFKHINPFTNDYNDVYIISSIDGAEEIKKRWNNYDHLRNRNVDNHL